MLESELKGWQHCPVGPDKNVPKTTGWLNLTTSLDMDQKFSYLLNSPD